MLEEHQINIGWKLNVKSSIIVSFYKLIDIALECA